MKVSLNTVRQFIDFDLPPVDELVVRINAQLGGVEQVIDLAAKYKDAKIVKVVECEKHENADKLSVCKIDVGTDELVQVVCGAPNVHADMWAVWLPPESIVPSTFDDTEPFKLGARELRGVMSHGMLAAGDELAINSDHEGIVEITEKDIMPQKAHLQGRTLQAGASFAETFGLDDTIIDIENKMFTHRPDLFGQIGVAREISAILKGLPEGSDDEDTRFVNPSWYWQMPEFMSASGLELEVFNETNEKVPRIMFAAMKNVGIKPSPLWLQCALVAMGGKTINNIVDVTNYVMLLTAQPTHAYDYDKLHGYKIGARMAKAGEKLLLLNGKTYELITDDIVIADGEGVIGLGGIMGGGNSEVSADTKNIVLEVATFDMYAVRKSAMRNGVFTDALTRFNKGQSPLQNDHIMSLLISSIKDVSPAEQASDVYDLPDKTGQLKEVSLCNELRVSAGFINARLGIDLTVRQIGDLLRRVNFASYPDEDDENTLLITTPFWRTDIELPEDVVEEVGRLYGFDKLPRELPIRSIKPAPKNTVREIKQTIRDSLSKAGANEVLTYSFVHENVMQKAGQDTKYAYRLSNALSPDLQFYRTALMPSLLAKVHMNQKAGHDKFALYEIGKTHFKGEMDEHEPSVPNEDNHVALVLAYTDKQKPAGAPYFAAKKYLETIMNSADIELQKLSDFDLTTDEWGAQLVSAYDPNRAVVLVRDGQIWGVVGEFSQLVRHAFKLPYFVAGFEVNSGVISGTRKGYVPLSKFPSVTQDISLKVSNKETYKNVFTHFCNALSEQAEGMDLNVHVSPVTIYQAQNDKDHKTITLRANITSHDKTLKDSEVAKLLDVAAAAVQVSI